MLTSYITCKHYPNGESELVIKNNIKQTPKIIEKRIEQIKKNREEKTHKKQLIIKQLNELTFFDIDKKEELEKELASLDNVKIENVKRSVRRSRQALYDIARCNDFDYFVTLTFAKEKVNRYDDNAVKDKFTQWANYIRKKHPNMHYIAVPEYHKLGGLHFHLLIGGIPFEDLQPKTRKINKGTIIYTVGAWTVGYSTVSKIKNKEATKHYICKYITKQNYDQRFYNKKRYYVSYNLIKPTIEKYEDEYNSVYDTTNLNLWLIGYLNPKKQYSILKKDNNGVLQENTPSAELLFRNLKKTAREQRDHLTIRTLDRKTELKEIEKAYRRTLESQFEDVTDFFVI